MKYNDDAYKDLLALLVNDIHYSDSSSFDARIASVRRYTEIIVRRILNYDCNKPLTLGNTNTERKLIKAGITKDDTFFWNSLKDINDYGSKKSHVQYRVLATEEDFNIVIDNLFNLYSYLFIRFFRKYAFGSNSNILSAFSTLPPIIRYKTLNELFVEDPDNGMLIEKMALSMVKAFDQNTAYEWIESHKEKLENMHDEITDDAIAPLVKLFGEETARQIALSNSENYYNRLKRIVELQGKYINTRGALYEDFEGALKYYKSDGIVSGDTPDVKEFNSLMAFLYTGRKEREKELITLGETEYVIDRILVIVKPE